jgi:hypothetical protein
MRPGRPRPFFLSALLIAATIAAGLALRLTHFGLPFAVTKYGGSMLWALMIYWIVSSIRPRWPVSQSALAACAVATAVELFKLVHAPALDVFRMTLPGALLLGRVFSPWDLVAYAFAIVLGAVADRGIRSRGAS